MAPQLSVGDAVQTPFGKGVVREVRNGGRVLVDVGGRAMIFSNADVAPATASRPRRRSPAGAHNNSATADPRSAAPQTSVEVDLHGLTVEEALARVEIALNDALLDDVAQLRFIHGRSGGRLRAALHARLRAIASVRHFRVDPRNAGVTIVEL